MSQVLVAAAGLICLVLFVVERHHWLRLRPGYIRLVARIPFDIGEPLPPGVDELLADFRGQEGAVVWQADGGEVLFRGGGPFGFRYTGRL
ncbi:MAG: hypothetical protein GY913_22605 [Proteobacteria bacterium]|nr:hypothetical protein [Pseudomonadota bacterium]MCP4919702.1 hypothetical protein [Pseudomonadota bacterium]